jgi:DNA-binding CsgD family transcriptional regulator
MEQGAELHAVIEQLYRAATGSSEATWACALSDVMRVVRGHTVALCEIEVSRRALRFHVEVGVVPPGARRAFKSRVHLSDPLLTRLHATSPGCWVHCPERGDDASVCSAPFDKAFQPPDDGRWVSGIKLIASGDTAVSLLVTRRAELGPLAGDDFLACDLLSFHIAKAYAFAQLHARLGRQHAAAELVMQHRGSPIVLVDGECRVLFANRLARSLMSSGSALSEREGRVALAQAEDDRALRALADRLYREADAARLSAGSPPTFAASEHVGIARPAGLRLAGMTLMLLQDKETSAFISCPVLLAVVHELKGDLQTDSSILASAFDLTRAEAKVALCIAQGMPVALIAELHGLALSTTRRLVQSVKAKPNGIRLVEVINRMRSIPFMFFGLRWDDEDGTATAAFSPRRPAPHLPHASGMFVPDDFA